MRLSATGKYILAFFLTLIIYYYWYILKLDCIDNSFHEILLVIVFNHPFYGNIPRLQSLYSGAFPNMIFCGPQEHNITSSYEIFGKVSSKGYFTYHECAGRAIMEIRDYSGYLVMSDDVLLNFWNFDDFGRILEGPKTPVHYKQFGKATSWYWWSSRWGFETCLRALNDTKRFYEKGVARLNSYAVNDDVRINSSHGLTCYGGRADIYFIPKHHADMFVRLARVFFERRVFLEIAVPTINRMLTNAIGRLEGVYMPGRVGTDPVSNIDVIWSFYNPQLHFIHPVKLHEGKNSTMNAYLDKFIREQASRFTNCVY